MLTILKKISTCFFLLLFYSCSSTYVNINKILSEKYTSLSPIFSELGKEFRILVNQKQELIYENNSNKSNKILEPFYEKQLFEKIKSRPDLFECIITHNLNGRIESFSLNGLEQSIEIKRKEYFFEVESKQKNGVYQGGTTKGAKITFIANNKLYENILLRESESILSGNKIVRIFLMISLEEFTEVKSITNSANEIKN